MDETFKKIYNISKKVALVQIQKIYILDLELYKNSRRHT